jgi:hypothetical protein
VESSAIVTVLMNKNMNQTHTLSLVIHWCGIIGNCHCPHEQEYESNSYSKHGGAVQMKALHNFL